MYGFYKIKLKLLFNKTFLLIILFFLLNLKNNFASFNTINENSTRLFLKDSNLSKSKDELKKNFAINDESIHDSLIYFDSTKNKNFIKLKDSVNRLDSLSINSRISNDSLDELTHYEAKDSCIIDLKTNTFRLYGNSKTKYGTTDLSANVILFYQKQQLIEAFGKLIFDSVKDDLSDRPTLKDKDITSISDTILYNLKTSKGFTQKTFFQQGEIYIQAERMKKINKTDFYAHKVNFTTCNLDHPHFGFYSKKSKLIKNKLGLASATVPEIEGVKLPIGVPFLIYPIIKNRQSGFRLPTINQTAQFGFGLQGASYYYALNDHIDLTLGADVYVYGSLKTRLSGRFDYRYRFKGDFTLNYNSDRTINTNFNSVNEFNKSNSFGIMLNYQLDPKVYPGLSFGARVNFQSSNFNQSQVANLNAIYSSTASSSISFSRVWDGNYNLGVSLSHYQNNQTHMFTYDLPNINFSMATQYPFSRKNAAAPKWYEKLAIGYSTVFSSSFSYIDTLPIQPQIKNTYRWNAQHNIPITLVLPQLGPVTATPFVTYNERWYGSGLRKVWTQNYQTFDGRYIDTLLTVPQYGFIRVPSTTTGINFNTRIFGTFRFDSSRKLLGIRHQITPSFSLSYTPDVSKPYVYSVQIDTTGRQAKFNLYTGQISPINGPQGSLGFGIDNFIEAKIRDTKDTTKFSTKKVKIIDGLGFNGSYNLLADSFALSPINIYFRTTLFNKININANASLNMYKFDPFGRPINKFNIDIKKGKFGQITSAGISFNSSFSSNDNKNDNLNTANQENTLTPDELQSELNYINANPQDYIDFKTKWRITCEININYANSLNQSYNGLAKNITSNIKLGGELGISEKWKITGDLFYDVILGKIQTINIALSRDLHCWQLTIRTIPIGIYKSISILFSPRSLILRDLKINRNRVYN